MLRYVEYLTLLLSITILFACSRRTPTPTPLPTQTTISLPITTPTSLPNQGLTSASPERIYAHLQTLVGVRHPVVPENGENLPDTRRSDHSPFWDTGYQAILLTDTSEFRNPHYHQPGDTLDTLNLTFITNVSQAVGELVATLADP